MLCGPLPSYKKSAVFLFDMYSQQFTLCYCLSRKSSSSYWLKKFVYVTSQLLHSLVVHPLLRELILDLPLVTVVNANILHTLLSLANSKDQ